MESKLGGGVAVIRRMLLFWNKSLQSIGCTRKGRKDTTFVTSRLFLSTMRKCDSFLVTKSFKRHHDLSCLMPCSSPLCSSLRTLFGCIGSRSGSIDTRGHCVAASHANLKC